MTHHEAHDSPVAADHDNYAHHVVAPRTYAVVFGVLCGLTALMLVTYTDLWRSIMEPQTTRGFLLLLACGQALLVALFLMHLKYEAAWKYVLTIPSGVMAVLLMLMLVPDIGLRTYRYSTDRWTQSAAYDGAAFYISQMLPLPDDVPLSRTARDEEQMPNVNVGPQPPIEQQPESTPETPIEEPPASSETPEPTAETPAAEEAAAPASEATPDGETPVPSGEETPAPAEASASSEPTDEPGSANDEPAPTEEEAPAE